MMQSAFAITSKAADIPARHVVPGLSAGSMLTVITALRHLRALEKDWRELEANAANGLSVFQSFSWTLAWAESYCSETSGCELHILAGYESGKLVFIWPLKRVRTFGLSVLSWATEPVGQYGDVLVRKGQCSKAWLAGSVALLKRFRDVDVLRLRHVRSDSHFAKASSLFHDARLPEQAPFLDLTAFADEEAYDQRYSNVQRKRRRKIRKALSANGEVSFRRLTNGTDTDRAMELAIAEKNLWLRQRGRVNKVMGCPRHISFLKSLSRQFDSGLDLVVTEIAVGGKPVSWEVGFRFGKTHYAYLTSHLNELTDLSPGRLHMDMSQRACLTDGMERFDLMVPNDHHKESWSSGKVSTNDYYLPLSWSGALLGHSYLFLLRPLLRAVYYRMQPGALRWLNPANWCRSRHPEADA